MRYVLDVFAVLVVALILWLPAPGVHATPAATGDSETMAKMAELQDRHRKNPGDAALTVELARAYLAVEQPGWALATLAPLMESGLPEVHQVAGYSHATLLRPADALRHAELGLKACDSAQVRCPETTRVRLDFLRDLMSRPASEGVDPKKDPMRARRMIIDALRTVRPGAPKGR